jgi:hypothetical protein
VDFVPRLDIRKLRRRGGLRPGGVTTGTLEWTRRGGQAASVDMRIDLRDGVSQMVLEFDFDGQPFGQAIDIVNRPMPYGGRRYYFVCPRRGHRCEVLALVGGQFASRQAHRLTYQSQSDDLLERLRGRRDRLWGRLRPEGRQRARGQHGERLFEAFLEADGHYNRLFDWAMARIEQRIRRLDALEKDAIRRAKVRRAKARPAAVHAPPAVAAMTLAQPRSPANATQTTARS